MCLLVYMWTHPTVISKMLEPTELDTAMSPRPFRATITLVIRSGIEVPAANMVKPMISSVIQKVSPTYNEAKFISLEVETHLTEIALSYPVVL